MNIMQTISDYIKANSGLDQHRDYLGLSKIADCPRKVVLEYRNGITVSEQAHRMCYAGYEQEESVKKMLRPYIHNEGLEVVAKFDGRLRGHIDAETFNSELVEIKSVSSIKFAKVAESAKALSNHFIQIQLYMHYGGWRVAWVIYRCRETYEHRVIRVIYNSQVAEKYETKAKYILASIDANTLPACECGYCDKEAK